jgi:hypothetical protein
MLNVKLPQYFDETSTDSKYRFSQTKLCHFETATI